MVAGSRSSLRRPTLRSRKSSRSSSPPVHDAPALLPKSGNEGIALRTKRLRSATVTAPEQDLKRRRLSTNKGAIPELRIPLRSRGGFPGLISPPPPGTAAPAVGAPKFAARNNTAPQTHKPIDSPSGKPQYDQIKIIEARAKASIRGGSATSTQEERRKLRSEDGGSRAKTELAQYFPEFEDMLSLKPVDPGTITVRTKVILVDDVPDFEPRPTKPDPFGAYKPLYNTEPFHVTEHGISTDAAVDDPLNEEVYLKIHGKAERHEKQMKNSDRERAQHEKYQLEKLLEDLRGPDWLKTLGITGVTETEKKRYEPKRILFIRETQALIDKFKRWKEEEKRRKLEREQELLETAMEDDDDDEEEEEEEDEEEDAEDSDEDGPGNWRGASATSSMEEGEDDAESVSSQAPNSSELDALASQQLIEEAKIASKPKKPPPKLVPELPAPKPFVSFFEKRHLRDAAVAGRQRGRTVLAFGQPVPDFWEEEFELPEDILTEEAIRTSERSRRRLRRGTID